MATRQHRLDLTSNRFGRWTVLRKDSTNSRGEIFWLCRCDCGNERSVRANILKRGESTSCGCYHRDAVTKHGMTNSRTWKSWNSMLQRCTNPEAPDYHRYGGRGVTVCPEWRVFERFLSDLGERPSGRTLDRIDTNGNYESGNCQWATGSAQQRNKQAAIRATVNGVTRSIHDWAEETGIPAGVIKWRLEQGWPHAEAISKAVRPKRPPS